MELSEGVHVTLLGPTKGYAKDIEAGDKADGFRLSGIRINRGRRWKRWDLPAAILRLERRGYK